MSNMVDMRETIYRPSWVQSHGAMTESGNYYDPKNAQNIQYARVFSGLRAIKRPNTEPTRTFTVSPYGTAPTALPAAPDVQQTMVRQGQRLYGATTMIGKVPYQGAISGRYPYQANMRYGAPNSILGIPRLPPIYNHRVGGRPIIPAPELQPRQYLFGSPLDWLKSLLYRMIDFIKSLNPFGSAAASVPATPAGPAITPVTPVTTVANTLGQGSTSIGAGPTVNQNAILAYGSPAYFGNHTNIFSKSVIS